MNVHFPGLNGLRFFAALAVAISHVELMKQYHGLPNAYDKPAVYELGRLSVTLFFVLSGFLITYLLLAEKQQTGGIAVRKFYLRRVLRIWPLYFLVVLLSFFVLPRFELFQVPGLTAGAAALPLFLLFLPQLALSIHDPVPFAEPAWSIGVEEQFYLLWPALMRRSKNFVVAAFAVIAVIVGARYAALFMAQANRADADALLVWNRVINYLYFTRIECMAIGGLFAWIVFAKKKTLLAMLHHRVVELGTYAAIGWLLVTDRGKPIFNYGLYSILFAILILNISTNPRSLVRMNGPRFEFLGNISFSIYMLHELAIQMTIRAGLTSNALLYPVSMTLTVAVASACYLSFERPFLRLKSRYAVTAAAGSPTIRTTRDAAVASPVT